MLLEATRLIASTRLAMCRGASVRWSCTRDHQRTSGHAGYYFRFGSRVRNWSRLEGAVAHRPRAHPPQLCSHCHCFLHPNSEGIHKVLTPARLCFIWPAVVVSSTACLSCCRLEDGATCNSINCFVCMPALCRPFQCVQWPFLQSRPCHRGAINVMLRMILQFADYTSAQTCLHAANFNCICNMQTYAHPGGKCFSKSVCLQEGTIC